MRFIASWFLLYRPKSTTLTARRLLRISEPFFSSRVNSRRFTGSSVITNSTTGDRPTRCHTQDNKQVHRFLHTKRVGTSLHKHQQPNPCCRHRGRHHHLHPRMFSSKPPSTVGTRISWLQRAAQGIGSPVDVPMPRTHERSGRASLPRSNYHHS